MVVGAGGREGAVSLCGVRHIRHTQSLSSLLPRAWAPARAPRTARVWQLSIMFTFSYHPGPGPARDNACSRARGEYFWALAITHLRTLCIEEL